MDVISSHQAGVCEAVATSGTAMTEQHLKILSNLTSDIRLAYDGDDAGVNAAERAIEMAGDLGIDLSSWPSVSSARMRFPVASSPMPCMLPWLRSTAWMFF